MTLRSITAEPPEVFKAQDTGRRHPRRACVLNSNRWLHEKLTASARLDPEFTIVAHPSDADLVLYPVPLWTDSEAPQRRAVVRLCLSRRFFQFSQNDVPDVWTPGVYTSLGADSAFPESSRAAPYLWPNSFDAFLADRLDPRPDDDPQLLWSFVGSVSTRPALRGAICDLVDQRGMTRNTDEFNDTLRWSSDETRERAMLSFFSIMRDSKFVVCPRGIGVSSVRLFETMRMGRVPIVVSDRWVPPPFVDWASCVLRVAERDVGRIPQCAAQQEERSAEMGAAARAEWERFYAPDRLLNTLLLSCETIAPEARTGAVRLRLLAAATTRRQPYRLVLGQVRQRRR